MVGEGADILSQAFCDVFNAHQRGEDVSHLFYEYNWQLINAVDYITNTWLTLYDPAQEKEPVDPLFLEFTKTYDVFIADCNRGTYVQPEYRFAVLLEDGSEYPAQDYSTQSYFICPTGAIDGMTLRVYARVAGEENAQEHWYDLIVRE